MSTVFPHRSIYIYTWTSPEGITHNQTDHVLVDRRWYSIVADALSSRGVECDTDHYLVVAKVRQRLSGSE